MSRVAAAPSLLSLQIPRGTTTEQQEKVLNE